MDTHESNVPQMSETALQATQEIQAWLDNPEAEYASGLALLSRYCRNRILIQTLMKKQSQVNCEKLTYELSKLLTQPELLESQPSEAKVVVLSSPNTPHISIVDLADSTIALAEIEAITLKQSELYARKAELSNLLVASGDSNEPQAVADRMLLIEHVTAIEEQYRELAEQKERLSHLAQSEPEQTDEQAQQQAEAKASLDSLKLQRTRLAPNLSKARKAAEADPGSTLKAEKLAKLEAEMADIDEKIKLLSL